MMRRIAGIVSLTFREAQRNQVFYSLFFFGLALVASSVLAGELTLGAYGRVLRDVGTAALDLLGFILAAYQGLSLMASPSDKKAMHMLLATPLRRWEYVVGRVTGGVCVVGVAVGAMFVVLLGALALVGGQEAMVTNPMVPYVILRLASLILVVVIALLFSTLASNLVAALGVGAIVIAGTFASDVYFFASRGPSAVSRYGAWCVYALLPDFSLFDLSHQVAYLRFVPWGDVGMRLGYAAGYAVAALLATLLIFERKNLE